MIPYETVLIEYSFQERIATVTMNRAEMHNALNMQLSQDLYDAFSVLSKDERLVGVVLTGAGKSFSAGADLRMMQAAAQASLEQNEQDALRLARTFELINAFPAPIVARVNGAAMGGGLGLIAVSDIAIATQSARMAFSEVKLGITPAVISPFVVSKIGPSQARRFFVTGERFTAHQAREMGLVHMVVESEELDNTVAGIVQELLSGGPYALRACKALARDIDIVTDKEEARLLTAGIIAKMRVSPEGQEGIHAYLEKRQPTWISGEKAE